MGGLIKTFMVSTVDFQTKHSDCAKALYIKRHLNTKYYLGCKTHTHVYDPLVPSHNCHELSWLVYNNWGGRGRRRSNYSFSLSTQRSGGLSFEAASCLGPFLAAAPKRGCNRRTLLLGRSALLQASITLL